MKKIRCFILILCLFMISILPLNARAGGGGSSGGSGGGGGGGSSSTYYSNSSSKTKTPAERIIDFIPVILILGIGIVPTGIYRYRVYKKNKKSKALLKQIDDIDAFWNEDYLKQQIEVIYYTAQACWSDNNIEALKDYLSEDLYEEWKSKLQWIELRHEKNVLENISLLSSKIVSIFDAKDNEQDMFWVCIRGKMIDYTISLDDGSIINGDKKNREFIEYWKFIRRHDSFVLDEVRQKEEVDVTSFIDLSQEVQHEDAGSSLWDHREGS